MDEREELIAVAAEGLWRDVWGDRLHSDSLYASEFFQQQSMRQATAAVDALLADGRWLLVHPDEMIRPDELEQVGWAVPWSFHAPLSTDEYRFSLSNERERVSNHPSIEPVYRVRPAVEKENDQ